MPEKGSSTFNHSIVYVHMYKFVVGKRKRGTAEVVTVPTCDNMIIFHTRKPSQKHNNWGLILLLQYQPLHTQCSRQQKQFFGVWNSQFALHAERPYSMSRYIQYLVGSQLTAKHFRHLLLQSRVHKMQGFIRQKYYNPAVCPTYLPEIQILFRTFRSKTFQLI